MITLFTLILPLLVIGGSWVIGSLGITLTMLITLLIFQFFPTVSGWISSLFSFLPF